MAKLPQELRQAGATSLELQGSVRVPQADLAGFFSQGWPPFDARLGLIALTQIGDSECAYKVTFALGEEDPDTGRRRVVIEFSPTPADKITVSFADLGKFFDFLAQEAPRNRLCEVRGVLHLEHTSSEKGPFPVPYNDKMDIIGIRLAQRKKAKRKPFIENVIIERIGDCVHTRLATRAFVAPKGQKLTQIVRRVLKCRLTLESVMER